MIDKYLESLINDRDTLADNLIAKGIPDITGNETFTELVPEVLNIDTEPDLQDKTITITQNGTVTVSYDVNYDGLNNVQITTNVSGGGSNTGAYKVTSIAERDSLTNLNIGDVCIVSSEEYKDVDVETSINTVFFPSAVTLSSEYQNFTSVEYEASNKMVNASLDSANFYFNVDDWEGGYSVFVQFTSSDGIHYTRSADSPSVVSIGQDVSPMIWGDAPDNEIFEFYKNYNYDFIGAYSYDGSWNYMNVLDKNVDAFNILPGTRVYSSKGFVNGAFGAPDTVDRLSTILNLQRGDIDASSLTSLYGAFDGSRESYYASLTDWSFLRKIKNTQNVVDLSLAFANDTGVTQLDLSNWDLSKVTDMTRCFYGDTNLSSITFPSSTNKLPKITENALQNFVYGTQITKLDLRNWDFDDTTSVLWNLTMGANNLKTIGLTEDFDVILPSSIGANCASTSTVSLYGSDANGAVNNQTTILDLRGLTGWEDKTVNGVPGRGRKNITAIYLPPFKALNMTTYMGEGSSALRTLVFEGDNIELPSGEYNGGKMYLSGLRYLDIHGWRLDKVPTSFWTQWVKATGSNAFQSCEIHVGSQAIKDLILQNFPKASNIIVDEMNWKD